jgi:hypothetical protein
MTHDKSLRESNVASSFHNNVDRFPIISYLSRKENPMVSIHGYTLLFDSIIAEDLIASLQKI